MTYKKTNISCGSNMYNAGTVSIDTVTRRDISHHFAAKEHWDKLKVVETPRIYKQRFSAHEHPFASKLIGELNRGSVAGVLAADTAPEGYLCEDFDRVYGPKNTSGGDPVDSLAFDLSEAYSLYNWELFFHAPLMLGIHLSRNGSYEEARRWFHYIFDPTIKGTAGDPSLFWQVKPFREGVKSVGQVLLEANSGSDDKRKAAIASIDAWRDAPFQPHVVARYRPTAYMLKTVIAYLDNLIEWGDSLYRQDTRESIGEALQLYVMAANLLGSRPQSIPQTTMAASHSYASLKAELDGFSNVAKAMENYVGGAYLENPATSTDTKGMNSIASLGRSLYFQIPLNPKLLGCWDTVADRLFKIRNSLNIEGVFRQLPLFAPPIDPGLLVKAAAAGVNVASIVNGLNISVPLVRFRVIVQKALELARDVKGLGDQILSAIEKADNEAMAILRAKHEVTILGLAETVRYQQLQEAIKAREGAQLALASAWERRLYYEKLLGNDEVEPDLPALDPIEEASFLSRSFHSEEPELAAHPISVSRASGGVGDDNSKLSLTSQEQNELELMASAQLCQDAATAASITAIDRSKWPDVSLSVSGGWPPVSVGISTTTWGGTKAGDTCRHRAEAARGVGSRLSFEASKTSKIGAYTRRQQEWTFQSNLAAREMNQSYKGLRAAQIRECIAQNEWKNHQKQIELAKEVEEFLADEKKKRANKDFYLWMKRELKGLHSRCYDLAYWVAKKAERALQYELGNTSKTWLEPSYTGGQEGLLAGEKLCLDIQRMMVAYQDENEREYELTKHISLLQLDPKALLKLKTQGWCDFDLPETIFDLDCPGHYFRRIKTLALSIPCVTGPYASINCKVIQESNRIRISSAAISDTISDKYIDRGDSDERFVSAARPIQTMVTSTASNDSGMFEPNLQDERYLPFEGTGVVGHWRLELPENHRQFDYSTISDIILHLRYTARSPKTNPEGFKKLASDSVDDAMKAMAKWSTGLFSIRHEFPWEWAQFKASTSATLPALTITLTAEHYPIWLTGVTNVAEAKCHVKLAEADELKVMPVSMTTREGSVTLDFNQLDVAGLKAEMIADAWLIVSPVK